MKFLKWFRPGIKIKRWFVIGFMGIAAISYGLSYFRVTYKPEWNNVFSIILIISGVYFIYLAIRYGLGTLFSAIKSSGFNISLDKEKLTNLLLEKRILIKGPKVVVVGGGTGLSTMLRGLKQYSCNITAVVTVADDGGGSGVLRQDLNMLPPGDIRNCVLALADTEPLMEQLMQYRFTEGSLKGQSFGNLFLAAMDGISNNFEEAVKKMSDVLAVTGRVLPVTLANVNLCAEFKNGEVVKGESQIGKKMKELKLPIEKVYLEPKDVKPLNEALEAIKEADVIVLGPGSLYTSVIPNLLVQGLPEEIQKSKAIKIYVCNVMTQPGETDGFTVSDHLKVLFDHSKQGIVDYCIVNNSKIPNAILDLYKEDGACDVKIDENEVEKLNVKIIEKNLLNINGSLVRHNSNKLAETIIELVSDKILSKDKKRIIDYFYVKDRLKKLVK